MNSVSIEGIRLYFPRPSVVEQQSSVETDYIKAMDQVRRDSDAAMNRVSARFDQITEDLHENGRGR